jgi:hypothetical protein
MEILFVWRALAQRQSKEAKMADTKRMVDESKRIGEEAAAQARKFGQATQEQVIKAGQHYQQAAQSGFEAPNRSLGEVNRGFQALAAEMAEYSKKTFEDLLEAWEQLLRARSLGDIVDIQVRYAQRTYDTHAAEMSKLAELNSDIARNALKPIDETSKRFTQIE